MQSIITASDQAMAESSSHALYVTSLMESTKTHYISARTSLRTVSCSTVSKYVKHPSYSWMATQYRYRTPRVRALCDIDTNSHERIYLGFECIHIHKSSQKANIFDLTPSRKQSLRTKACQESSSERATYIV